MCPERSGFLSYRGHIFRARSRNEVSVYGVVDRHDNSNELCKRRKVKAEIKGFVHLKKSTYRK